jgi:3-hydroxyacyl-CoA dehydrogenase
MDEVRCCVADGIALIELDHPPVNTLSHDIRQQLHEQLRRALGDPGVSGIVLTGSRGRPIAGADIREFKSGVNRREPTLRSLQDELEQARKPVVAAIDGAAVGGGFELAMACHWRVASRTSRVGLPEVKLGLIPGAGGTQRFPRLAGPEAALEYISTGEPIPAARALDLGLLDEVAEDAVAAATEFARRVVREGRSLQVVSTLTDKIRGVDPRLFAEFRARIERKARGQLAPWKIIDCIEAACTRPRDEAFQFERASFIECSQSPQHRALTHLFFAERAARRVPGLSREAVPLPVRRAGVIGAGTMGAGIAIVFAGAGIPVKILEASPQALAKGLEKVRKTYATSVERGSMTRDAAEHAQSMIIGVSDIAALQDCDLIIEAVFEDLDVKRELFARLDVVAAPSAILATNTSALDIDMIASATSHPERVIGMHFFSPANVMKLLENVRGRRSSAQTIATVMELGRQIGKVAVLAGNCDGFIGNRMWQYYTAEAEFLLEEGATPEQVDGVMETFGLAMGPLAVRDLAGNDVGLMIRKRRQLPPDERTSPLLARLVELGRLGQKSGKGYYRYEGRKRLPDPEVLALIEAISRERGIERRVIPDAEILARLLHPLVNEGAKILAEGIALRSSDIDLVYVNGYGFPAYRGGPMFWADGVGLEAIIATMRALAPSHGQRWAPAALLLELAASGRGFASLDAEKAGGTPRA